MAKSAVALSAAGVKQVTSLDHHHLETMMATSRMPRLLLTITIAAAATASAATVPTSAAYPPLELGNYTLPITTAGGAAVQQAFDLGMMHEFGFNQAEARIAFAAAVAQDPHGCPMCYWGLAYAWGPFLNHPTMSPTYWSLTIVD